MNTELGGRRYLVGGGSRGIGKAVASALIERGAQVVLNSRTAAPLELAAEEFGAGVSTVVGDLFAETTIDSVLDLLEESGRLDGILINGASPKPGTVLEVDQETLNDSYRMLVEGPVRLVRALKPRLADDASIVFVTSSSVRELIPGLDMSNVFRPAVGSLVKCLARDLAPGVRVNAVAPGKIDTGRVRSLDANRAERQGLSPEEVKAGTVGSIPAGRYGDPAEFAQVAAFLLSPNSSYVNGASIQVDGGLQKAIP